MEQLIKFEKYLAEEKWYQISPQFVGYNEAWICEKDVNYQIRLPHSDEVEEFHEHWTRVYPDSEGSYRKYVHLTYIGQLIKEYLFVSLDGGRYFALIPELQAEKDDLNRYQTADADPFLHSYRWNKDDLGYKVMEMIGDPEEVSRRSRIDIFDSKGNHIYKPDALPKEIREKPFIGE